MVMNTPTAVTQGMPQLAGFSGAFKILTAGLVFYPIGLLVSLYLTWFTAWAVLGHMPRPNLDDPKYISSLVDIPYAATSVLGTCMPGVFMAGLLGVFVLGRGLAPSLSASWAKSDWGKVRVGFVALGCFVVCWGAAVSFFVADPWDVFGWYMD